MQNLEEDKKSLIELIEWYKNEYHKKDFGHNEMIEEIKKVSNYKELETFEQTVDLWLD
jgi:hypothetical protein